MHHRYGANSLVGGYSNGHVMRRDGGQHSFAVDREAPEHRKVALQYRGPQRKEESSDHAAVSGGLVGPPTPIGLYWCEHMSFGCKPRRIGLEQPFVECLLLKFLFLARCKIKYQNTVIII